MLSFYNPVKPMRRRYAPARLKKGTYHGNRFARRLEENAGRGATVADVAASIGAGLAKAALAGKIDGKLVDLTTPAHDGAAVEIITRKARALQHPAPFLRPYHGP